jgi:2-oxo-4-hydroxy-4-carboxy-5-ureidoimidazoline decarboxylase
MNRVSLAELNAAPRERFVAVCGPVFERSPWIAERACTRRPFDTVSALHAALMSVLAAATDGEKMALILAHPDLVGRLAREGRLSRASTTEQAAAGLAALSVAEVEQFDRFNEQYRGRFGFPFVICARENRKEAILRAFPVRLAHSREEEIGAALAEIGKIARLRLQDAVAEE